jgi:hypothetical protein
MARNRYFRILLVTFTLLLAALILTDVWPGLRGPAPDTSEWHWIHRLRPFSRWWLPVLAGGGMTGVTAWWLRTRHWRWGLAALVLGNLLLQGVLIYADNPAVFTELIERTLADETNGYFRLAADTADISTLLRNYPAQMPTFPSEHTRTHPPGLIVANWLALQTFQRWPGLSQTIADQVWPLRCTDLWLLNGRPAVAAALAAVTLLTMLAGALTVLPTFGLAHRLLSDKAARLATALVATLPALLIFTPTPVQADTLLAVTAVWLLQIGLERQQGRWFWLSGLLVSLMTFFSLGNGALLLLLAGYVGWDWWLGRGKRLDISSPTRPFTSLIGQFALLGLGTATIWLVYRAGWGVPPWSVAQVGLAQHYELVTRYRRYDWWLVYNLLDVLIFAGPVVVVGFVALFRKAQSFDRLRTSPAFRKPYARLLLPLVVLILLLDVSGSARGEVGRLWLFLMPFLAIGSAAFFSPGVTPSPVHPLRFHSVQALTRSPLYLIALQLLIALAIGLAWQPIEAVIVVAERPSLPANPIPQNPTDAAFFATDTDPTIVLRGYDLAQTDEFLDMTLYWQAARAAARPYTVFTHLLNQQGELAAQQDNWPVNGLWPPTCWQDEGLITDPYRLSLARLPSGAYTLTVGWYDARDNTRLRLADGQDALLLTTVVIEKKMIDD